VITEPTQIFIVWGWMHPLNLSEFTTPPEGTVGFDQDPTNTGAPNLVDLVAKRLRPYYDEERDIMKIPDATKKPFEIEGVRRVKLNDRQKGIALPQEHHWVSDGDTAINSPPDYFTTIRWKGGCNRPVHYKSSTGYCSQYRQDPFFYPGGNECLPFVLIYNPNNSGQGFPGAPAQGMASTGHIQYRMTFAEYWNDP
jgi:hypothetical protein